MCKYAGLNQRLFSAHERVRQPMLSMIVHTARIELHNVVVIAIMCVRRTAPHMHNAAVNVVFTNEVCDVVNELGRSIVRQRGVLQNQVVR